MTVGFPEKHFCLFVLRQYLIQEKDIDKVVLVKAIENMTVDQKAYKGLANSKDLIDYFKLTA